MYPKHTHTHTLNYNIQSMQRQVHEQQVYTLSLKDINMCCTVRHFQIYEL